MEHNTRAAAPKHVYIVCKKGAPYAALTDNRRSFDAGAEAVVRDVGQGARLVILVGFVVGVAVAGGGGGAGKQRESGAGWVVLQRAERRINVDTQTDSTRRGDIIGMEALRPPNEHGRTIGSHPGRQAPNSVIPLNPEALQHVPFRTVPAAHSSAFYTLAY